MEISEIPVGVAQFFTFTQSHTLNQLTLPVSFIEAPLFNRRSTIALFFLSHASIRTVKFYFDSKWHPLHFNIHSHILNQHLRERISFVHRLMLPSPTNSLLSQCHPPKQHHTAARSICLHSHPWSRQTSLYAAHATNKHQHFPLQTKPQTKKISFTGTKNN